MKSFIASALMLLVPAIVLAQAPAASDKKPAAKPAASTKAKAAKPVAKAPVAKKSNAASKAEATSTERMGQFTQGMNLPAGMGDFFK